MRESILRALYDALDLIDARIYLRRMELDPDTYETYESRLQDDAYRILTHAAIYLDDQKNRLRKYIEKLNE